MRSFANLLSAALLTGCGGASEVPREVSATTPPPRAVPQTPVPLPPEAGTPDGPSGTAGAGETSSYDEVGLATWYGEELAGRPTASGTPFAPAAITAAHRTLPLGSHAEVTALDTGRTILVLINDRGPGRRDRLIDLSRGAAEALGTGTNPMAPVRIRTVTAAPDDAAALSAGRRAARRLDTPPALLAALRRRLPEPATPKPEKAMAVAPRAPAPIPARSAVKGRYLVQVAAFSTESRARALADRLDGRVESGGGLWRVRLGPFGDAAAARRARDVAARQGYGDAAIITQ